MIVINSYVEHTDSYVSLTYADISYIFLYIISIFDDFILTDVGGIIIIIDIF